LFIQCADAQLHTAIMSHDKVARKKSVDATAHTATATSRINITASTALSIFTSMLQKLNAQIVKLLSGYEL